MNDIDRAALEAVECFPCLAKSGSPDLCASCRHNRAVVAYWQGEAARLRALVKDAQWVFDDGYCPWCKANIEPGQHDPSCPAFTPDGEVR